MNSFIISGGDEKRRNSEAKILCQKHKIAPVDITFVHQEKETSLGIELVKKAQAKVFLKPIQSDKKAVIIPEAQLLTIPAQNALLKLLEEPPENTILILLTASLETLLPTIQSRCSVVRLTQEVIDTTNEDLIKYQTMLKHWQNLSATAALKEAETLAKDKVEALKILEKVIIVGRLTLIDSETMAQIRLSRDLHKLQDTYRVIKSTNTSLRLALEQLFLSLKTL